MCSHALQLHLMAGAWREAMDVMRRLLLSATLSLLVVSHPVCGQVALELLQAEEPPIFFDGHTLPPLTRWGWTMPYEVRVELCENWGYALEFGSNVTPAMVNRLRNPGSVESRLCALADDDPDRYPLSVITHRALDTPSGDPWCHDANGALPDGRRIWSPEAPDEVFVEGAQRIVAYLVDVLRAAPIAIILNGGEYGLRPEGHHAQYWEQDPKVMAAKGDQEWFDFISQRKAHQETIIADAVREAVPDRTLYIHYYASGDPHRNRYEDWRLWSLDWEPMQDVSDMPNSAIYYRHFNSGWTGDSDMLTQALNAVAQQIAVGQALSYNWVCAGWRRERLGDESVSDPEHYMGYLKCYYSAGMIGGVARYFRYPREDDLDWLWQMVVLARCHALFSHLEDFLRNSELLPGPDTHKWSANLPAYEFPTGDSEARVLVRKLLDRDEWLVTAWAAGGEDRVVTVDVPQLGEVHVEARDCGSVYWATAEDGGVGLVRIDEDGMRPTVGTG